MPSDATAATPCWQTARFRIDVSRPRVMAIINATPDSFSGHGAEVDADDARRRCDRALAEGADLLDIGGESTRPGSTPPPVEEELRRVLPVVRHAVGLGVPISVDTSRLDVVRAVLDLGADIVNDVRALRAPGVLSEIASRPAVGVCLMHLPGEPATMQDDPRYGDVVAEVGAFLRERRDAVLAAGVGADRVVLDPGYGFGKTLEHNLELARRQRELLALGCPLMVGWSRKGTLGRLTGRPVQERVAASVGAALAAACAGATVLRVHDVAPTVDALKVWLALRGDDAGMGGPRG